MKLKEKWAIQDAAKIMGYTEQRVYIEGQGDIRWWLAGFEFAKRHIANSWEVEQALLDLGNCDAGPEPLLKDEKE